MRLIVLLSFFINVFSQEIITDPMITSWTKSTGIDTTYNCGNNVHKISYSTGYVYIYSNSIPSYSIGPWSQNPNLPACKQYTFKIPRNTIVQPQKTNVQLGYIGVYVNGVLIYNADDGQTYNNEGIYNRNAYVWELPSFDSCDGHPDARENYHMHINPTCLYNYKDSTAHSPIIGYIFDGFPVYGSYGYSNANDSSSSITRMTSSWQKDNSLTSNGRPNGPAVDSTYPLGSFIQDYIFSSGSGTLDRHNGRWCVTPEYPNGVYAYFATTENDYTPAYPFIVGPKYYGKLIDQGNGKNIPNEDVTIYFNSAESLSKGKTFINFFFIYLTIKKQMF